KIRLRAYVESLQQAEIRVSLFIEPGKSHVDAAKELGADIVELHTGTYCHKHGKEQEKDLARIQSAAKHAAKLGLECHAGHGLTYDTTPAIAAILPIVELNIGHFLISDAIFVGISESVRKMRACMDKARRAAS